MTPIPLQMQSVASGDQAYGMLTLVLFHAIAGYFLLRFWRKRQDRRSLYFKVSSLEDVGIRFLSALGQNKLGPKTLGTAITLYPTWGIRLITTAVAMLFAAYVWQTSQPAFIAENGNGMGIPIWAVYAFSLLVCYSLFVVWIGQMVTYDAQSIGCRFVQLTPQRRQLDLLHDISKHPKNPIYVLRFHGEKDMHVFSYMTQRSQFLSDMDDVIVRNAARLDALHE